MKQDYDAVIVGARVAGAATGLLLASAGARVLIIDRDPEIGDTLSTHALMRPAVELLSRWGLLDPLVRAGTPYAREALFQYGENRITVPVRPTAASPGLIAPRRWLLDRTILDAAVAAGAELSLATTFEHCIHDRGRVTGIVVCDANRRRRIIGAEVVIGADGRMSRIAEAVGAGLLAESPERATTLYGYFPAIPNQGYRWYFGDGVSAGAIPTNDGLHCVFAACRPVDHKALFGDALKGMATILRCFDPDLGETIAAGPVERLRRFPGAPGRMRHRAGDGWALVGDAAFFKDPATAHGISDALLDARALADALLHGGGLETYARERHEQSVPLFETTQRIASFAWDLNGLKPLHEELNACMKAEQASLAPMEAERLRVYPKLQLLKRMEPWETKGTANEDMTTHALDAARA